MNSTNNFLRYTLTNRLGVLQPQLLGESDLKISWNRKDEQLLDYEKEVDGRGTFTGPIFQELLRLEQSVFRCEYTDLLIEKKCIVDGAEVWSDLFTGRISMNDGNWNLDRCELGIKILAIDPHQCYQDNKSEEINLFDLIPARQSFRFYPVGMVIEYKEFDFAYSGALASCSTPFWGDPGVPETGHWINYYHSYTKAAIGTICFGVSKWARYAVTVPCAGPDPGPGWFLESDSCPSLPGKKYVREATLFGCADTVGLVHGSEYVCQIVYAVYNGVTDNGMALGDVIQAFADQFCEDLTVVSDFFQINPETPSSTNYVTGVATKVDKIFVFQKSDVKRPGALNNATKATWTVEKAMNAICTMFNCRWRITGNEFRVEHISFFPATPGIDTTQPRYAKYMVGMRKYSHASEKIPIREEFSFMEGKDEFSDNPIVYQGACVSRDNVKSYPVDDVTTDVELCLSNPEGDNANVDDRGFVFVACHEVGGEYFILTEPAITGPQKLNNTLAWTHLHRDYHKYYRPLASGIMNGVPTSFLSVRPTKKGDTINIPLCCGDVFNPDDVITTGLGEGIVEKASYSIRDNMLALDILYPLDNLVNNTAPVAANDTAEVVKNVPEEIDVLANDTDDDTIVDVEIVSMPANGTASVTIDKKILYTPGTNYVGSDAMVYRVRDTWGNWSNNGMIAIDVIPPALSMELVNDEYTTEQDEVLNVIAADGVLDNDTTVSGTLTVTPETKATAEGGAVEIFADGSFDYTPPFGFVGTDSFEYTASNGTDTDTANVNIVVTGEDRHLDVAEYSPDEPVTLTGHCTLDDFRICRTLDARLDAIAAGETVQVTVEFLSNTGCSFSHQFDFAPADNCSAPVNLVWCEFPPGCSSFTYVIASIIVI